MSASDSMTSVITSLDNGFRKIPPSAVPAMLDCILVSTGLSPSSVFNSLLRTFPIPDEDEDKLCEDDCLYMVSLVGALCHLLKKIGPISESVQLFLSRSFLPAMKMAHKLDRKHLNQIAEMFIDAVIQTNLWGILETTLVPFFLRAICLSLGVDMSEILNMFKWSNCMVAQCPAQVWTVPEVDGETLRFLSGFFHLSTSCQILILILDASLHGLTVTSKSHLVSVNGSLFLDIFSGNLLWDLLNLAEHLLLHSSEHRSCTVVFLLPTIFKTFINHNVFEVSVQGQTHTLSRSYLYKRIWNCCRTLFSLGPLERRDAYNIMSLYVSSFSFQSGDEVAKMSNGVDSDEIKFDEEFWIKIKRGLVDKDTLVRKQSLQILKTMLNISKGMSSSPDIFEDSQKIHSNYSGITKRDLWAEKEAKSLGLGNLSESDNLILNFQQQWEAFFLLYEMLDEYGTHLVEAAWNHQVSLLLQCLSYNDICEDLQGSRTKTYGKIFTWLPILWERGFDHDNPLVRCLIMQSFTQIEWKNCGNFAKSLPEAFVCGSFMQALNNPIHHVDFGLKKNYSSSTIEGATRFIHEYTRYLNPGERISFLSKLASLVKKQSFSRAGLMSLAECIASAACGIETCYNNGPKSCEGDSIKKSLVNLPSDSEFTGDITTLLESFRFVVESSKQHFNPSYRLQVCERVLDGAVSTICISDVPLKVVLHFISAIPWEFTNFGGCLRKKIQEWPSAWDKKPCGPYSFAVEKSLLKSLQDFPRCFTRNNMGESLVAYGDEQLDAWISETKIWARVLCLMVKEESHLEPILEFIRHSGSHLCNQESDLGCLTSKFLLLIMSLVHELQMLQETFASYDRKHKMELEGALHWEVNKFILTGASNWKFANVFCSIMDELVSFANISCSAFWSENHTDKNYLPGSIRGRLGGPSQRRLPSSTTTGVLQAIVSMKAVALISSWCAQFSSEVVLSSAFICLWKFLWKTISSPCHDTQIGAEKHLAAYEALAPVLKALVSELCIPALNKVKQEIVILPTKEGGTPIFDGLVLAYLQNINSLLAAGVLARTRYAVLLNWKWVCLESLLLFPYRFIENGYQLRDGNVCFSRVIMRSIFNELLESLENAGEGSILSMLRSVRLILGLYTSGVLLSGDSSCNELDIQMMWDLVRSSWILHANCNKRRVAHIAALLSAILHPSVFSDESMHITESEPGPIKWFVEQLLEDGTKSPRTIRLAALHLTGLWLSYPKTLKYYMKELKLLSLYGSVAFDEDFEGELTGNMDARSEVSLLAQSPDPDLTEEFINTELYARVSVAVLFQKLADFADKTDQLEESHAAIEAGKMFLVELLESVVNEKDLSKELYKKYSAIHRRKIRAWQMICVLSRFSGLDILGRVTDSLHISLSRNNLPAVRQYLETFAINIFLKFPFVVEEQLVPILRNYDMKPQALASYVFISANVILHSPEVAQARHLDVLLPPIIPLLTSHHHSLRGFTQLLVYHVLCKLYPFPESGITDTLSLEKRCFEDLKLYLAKNSDCMRLRASMEGYLRAYNPHNSVTPAGIFINRVEEIDFECVSTSLMDQVLSFLNDARDDLRSSMANDAMTIKNETLEVAKNSNGLETWSIFDGENFSSRSQDFQKKITPKHEKHDNSLSPLFSRIDTYKQLAGEDIKEVGNRWLSKWENKHIVLSSLLRLPGSDKWPGTLFMISNLVDMEREDQLFDHLFCSVTVAMENERASRQSFILVASLIDRVPNLAGLARTCEVFKASGLAIADASILQDKQFKLISVTADKWVPIIELPVNNLKMFLEKKKRQGFSVLGLEQTANSIPLDQYAFPEKTVLILGHEKEGIPVDIIHILDACIEIPQLGVVRSLNVHVSGAIALWEYTRQRRSL